MRFAGDVLAVGGVLLIVDATLTLAWQEPLSALLAHRSQSALEAQLDAALREPGARRPGSRTSAKTRRALASRYRRGLQVGEAVARLQMPTLGRAYVVIQGTGTTTLRKGPGHYPETPLPGEGGTVAIAGHRTTYGAPFRTVDRLRRADAVVLTLPYGRFTYRVEGTRIVSPSSVWVKRPVGYDRLILTACHPLYSAARRIVVFAKLARVDTAGTGS